MRLSGEGLEVSGERTRIKGLFLKKFSGMIKNERFWAEIGLKTAKYLEASFFIVTLQSDSDEDAKRRPREAETDDRKREPNLLLLNLNLKRKELWQVK